MITLPIKNDGSPLSVLFIGAHSDDIEIGCGGTVLSLLEGEQDVSVLWVVLSGRQKRRREAEEGCARFLSKASTKAIKFGSFTDGFFPSEKAAIKGFFESELKAFNPDIIFTHSGNDLHQDHQVINQLTWNTFRNHLVLEYEIPKYDGDLGNPNMFVPLSQSQMDDKVAILLNVFESQSDRHWFRDDVFRGLASIRGMQCASTSGYAEAFYNRKTILTF